MFRRFPPITLALVVGCILWTGLAWALDWTPSQAGAIREAELWQGAYWRLLTATFLHHTGVWFHLAMNAISLLFVGRVVERACGGRVYLIAIAGSALAGFSGSMLGAAADVDYWRMGISGSIAGLVGLVLAIEWAITSSFGQFIKQRNTLLILFFMAMSVPLASWIESDTVKVDHAAHAGGFLFGLLAGIAYYGRSRLPPDGTLGPFSRPIRRPSGGVAAVVLLGLLPILYVGHPIFDARYNVWRGDRAFKAGEMEEAADYYERALDLDPEQLVARARLAEVRDDPELLDGIEPPDLLKESLSLQRAYLALSRRRFESEPKVAHDLLGRAAELRVQSPELWISFAGAARDAKWFAAAYRAFQLGADWLRLTGQGSEEWRPRAQALRMLVESNAWDDPGLGVLVEAARTTYGAAGGLASEMEPRARAQFEDLLGGVAAAIGRATLGLESADVERVRELHRTLALLFKRLAENTGDDARRPDFRYRSAYWYWKELGEADPESFEWVKARFHAALSEAHETGDLKTRRAAEEWFKARGIEVPPPDLDEDEAGG